MRGNREKESLILVSKLIKQQLGDIQVTESKNQFDHYDLLAWYNKQSLFIEVKERLCNYEQFKNYSKEGFILENTKYNFLKGKLNRYMNLFRINGYIFIISWDINKIDNNILLKGCKATTDFEDTKLVDKQVRLLKPNQGKIFILKENRYENIDFDTLTDLLNE